MSDPMPVTQQPATPSKGLFGGTLAQDGLVLLAVTAILTLWVGAVQAGLVGGGGIVLGVIGLLEGTMFLVFGIAAWRVVRRRTGWERAAWGWFAAAVPATVVGATVVYLAGARVSITPTGDPLESALTITLYGILFGGLLVLGLGQAQSAHAWRRALDAAIIAGCLFFILWSALYRDQFEASSLSQTARAVVIVYPFLDAALLTLAALALAVPDPSRPAAYRFLLGGLAATFAGDVVSTYLLLQQSPQALTVISAGSTAGLGLMALAAVHVARSPPWQARGMTDQPLWARMLPLAAVAPAMGSAIVTVVEHGALSLIQFWTAFAVLGAVLLQLGFTVQMAFQFEGKLRAEAAFKTRLLRFISHEVANPLSPLRMQTAILRKDRPEKESRSWDIVDRSIERLLSLSQDVREMALAETQRLLTSVEIADVGAQVAAAAQSAAPLATQRGLELIVHSSVDPLPARLDRQRFGQVLDNLLSNALKFTQKPGRITMRVDRSGDNARVQVTDTGIGLSAADREGLFQPFRRAQDGLAPGLGLGLYLCRAIMGELGGAIGVDSPGRGQGATFWVTVPLDGTALATLPLGPVRAPVQLPAQEAPAATVTVKLS